MWSLLLTLVLAQPEQVAVMPLQSSTVPAPTLESLDASLVVLASRLGPYKTISPRDLDAQLGRERMKEAAGCPPESIACAAEIVGALGTRYLLSGTVVRDSGVFRVTLTLFDTRTQEARGRGQGALDAHPRNYDAALEMALRQVLGLPEKPRSELNFGTALLPPPVVQMPADLAVTDADVKVEQLLEAALDAQEAKAPVPSQVAAAWCALASVKKNPYLAEAKPACATWSRFAKAHERRMQELASKYRTLRDYLRLKRKTVEQKLAAVEAFLAAFADGDGPQLLEARFAEARLRGGDVLLEPLSCRAECLREFRCYASDFGCTSAPDGGDTGMSRHNELRQEWKSRVSQWTDAGTTKKELDESNGECNNRFWLSTLAQGGVPCRLSFSLNSHSRYACKGRGAYNHAWRTSFDVALEDVGEISVAASAPIQPAPFALGVTFTARPGKSFTLRAAQDSGPESRETQSSVHGSLPFETAITPEAAQRWQRYFDELLAFCTIHVPRPQVAEGGE